MLALATCLPPPVSGLHKRYTLEVWFQLFFHTSSSRIATERDHCGPDEAMTRGSVGRRNDVWP